MEMTTLNGTDRRLSAIGLGGMPMSLRGRPPESQSLQVIQSALDRGVRLIDTADSYCLDDTDFHHNESLIRRALDEWDGDRDQVTVATKGGLVRPDGRWETDGDPARLRRTIQESIDTLGGNRPIDLWQLHAPDPEYTLEEQLEPAITAKQDGDIRHIGLSNVSVEQIERARELVDIVSVQNQYNLWHRDPESDGVLAYCDNNDLTFLPWSPFGGSSRAAKVADIDLLNDIADRHTDASPYQVVLAWMRSKTDQLIPIPGASRLKTMHDSVDAAELQLDASDVDAIDDAF
jgi:aryl-alcohol dehydrogenase-like predicted oxidoreductase